MLREFRKEPINVWPPSIDDHLSMAHLAQLMVESTCVGYGSLITDQHVITSTIDQTDFER